MSERHRNFELSIPLTALWLLAVSLLAFTTEEREYIKKRDREFGIKSNRGGCQMPHPHPCNGDKAVQVHHICPQRYAKEFGIDPDFVENGITLCEWSHTHLIHPDIQTAKQKYGTDRDSYKKTFQARAEQLKKGVIYWCDKFDRQMHTIVIRSEQRARKAGLEQPKGHHAAT